MKVLAAAIVAVCMVTSCLGQQAYWGLSDEEVFKMRVGASMDAYELAYFGLRPADMPSADSMTYGTEAGSFYIQWHYGAQHKKVILNAEQQREFLKLIANYEALALDPTRLSLGYLRFLGVKTPLNRHEKNGRDAEIQTKSDSTYYGELAFVKNGYVGLYLVNLGYKAELAQKELVLIPIVEIRTLRVFNRRIGRYTGFGLGFALAGSFSTFDAAVLPFNSTDRQYAGNFAVLPAGGFLLGWIYDVTVGVKTTYIAPNKRLDFPQLYRLGARQAMFRGALPPELLIRITR